MTFLKDVSSRRQFVQSRFRLLSEQLTRSKKILQDLNAGSQFSTSESSNEASGNPDLEKQRSQAEKTISTLEERIEKLLREDIFQDLAKPEGPVFICNKCSKELTPTAPINQGNPDATPSRYKCWECDEYDLCPECATQPHEHQLLPEDCVYPTDVLNGVIRPKTIAGVLRVMFSRYKRRPCLGFRTPDGFSWKSFDQVGALVRTVGSHLSQSLHLSPGDRVALCSINCFEWFIVDLACLMFGLVTVPILPSLRPEQIMHSVNQSGAKVVFCAPKDASLFLGQANFSSTIILLDLFNTERVETPQGQVEEYQTLLKYSRFLENPLNLDQVSQAAAERDPSSLATIIYTSGSTGTMPKGAMFTDKIWRALLTADVLNWGDPIVIFYISEREICICVLVNGGRVGIASPDHSKVFEDLLLVSPSRLDSTPRFWNVIYQQYKAAEQIEESLLMTKMQRSYVTEEERDSIAKRLKDKFRAILGTRCRSVSMGGAAVSQDLKQFMKFLFPMIQVREGYGTTEVGSVADDTGRIHPGIEFKLLDVPQLGYTQEDKPFPRGELCVRSNVTIQGYYGNEADTANAFDKDGFFRTGDVVALIDKRRIKIIDRVKNFFKLSQGEYISAEPIENVFLNSSWVDQIFIGHADLGKFPSQTSVLAAVVPQESAVRKWLNISPQQMSFADVCSTHSAAIKRKLLEEFRSEASKAQLRDMEVPRGLVIDHQQWTVENGLLTSSYKLCRPALRSKYQPLLDAVYEDSTSPSSSSTNRTNSSREDSSKPQQEDSGGSKLLRLLREVLGLKDDSDLSESTVKSLGGDSLSAIRLSHVIKSTFNVNVDAGALIHMSVTQLEEILSKGISSYEEESNTDFEAEASLPEHLISRISAAEPATEVGGILVTGCTGFVGSHIIMDLISHMKRHPEDQRSIYALVRSPTIDLASQKLTESLRNLRIIPTAISESDIEKYVNVVPGDLDSKRLGLPESVFRTLSDNVSLIVHGGAQVNHVLSYSDLKRSNVGGTLEVIEFACSGKRKRVIYLSTISVFSWAGRTQAITEDLLPTVADAQRAGGYASSKWVAEKLFDKARTAGMSVSTLRLGMVSWNSSIGVPNRQDWFYRLLLGLWALGSAPKSSHLSFINLIPVEVVTRVVVACIFQLNANVTHLNLVSGCLTSLEIVIKSLQFVESARDSPKLADLADSDKWVAPYGTWRSMIDKAIATSRSAHNGVMEKILSPLLLFRSGLPDDKREKYQLDKLIELLDGSELQTVLRQPLSSASLQLAWSTILSDYNKLIKPSD